MIKMTKIICVLIGHNFINEMQAITQIFFANAKFAFFTGENGIPPTGFAVAGRLLGKTCIGELYQNGAKTAACTVNFADNDNGGDDTKNPTKTLKRNLMLALFYVLQDELKLAVPWGALTGVRPAKQVRLWLQNGETEQVITRRLQDIYKCRLDKVKLAIAVAHAEERLLKQHKIAQSTGLYVGVPFCPSRCLYCSFVVSQKPNANAHSRYLAALAAESQKMQLKFAADLAKTPINAIYVGGGTPTAFSAEDLATLLKIIQPYNSGKIEYTVEAGRADSITQEKLKLLKHYGVTRIAINPQTLNDATLQRIGRLHTTNDFYRAYEMAVNLGFDNINTDIIAGLPGETPADMLNTMSSLKKLAPAHITVHTLAVKRASRLNENKSENSQNAENAENFQNSQNFNETNETNAKMVDEMLNIAQEICENSGLFPYYMYRQKNTVGHFENVGYSRLGYESIYNIAMMAETQTVIGLGAGAVTKILTVDKIPQMTKIERQFNPKNTETYIERTVKL
ncbi:MAG: coproporphyrinogen dehydrogenase HemZ [Defluviitaleaceae bacterium]|nr:coproporphyrinogen dehydrogenase HemZ [Defluviitaleaceae bacterium]